MALAYSGLAQVQKCFSRTNPTLPALLEIICGVRNKVSPEVVCEGARTRFLHPRDVLMRSGKVMN